MREDGAELGAGAGGEAQPVGIASEGPGAAYQRGMALTAEAVVVGPARFESGDVDVDGVVCLGSALTLTGNDRLPQLAIAGDDPFHRDAVSIRLDPRPDHHLLCGRVARGNPM